jgi:hypothetical protein
MLRMVPLPRSVSLRGGGKTTPFSRHIVPELCLRPRTNRSAPGNQRGKRSAERRIQPMPRSTSSCRHEPAASGAARAADKCTQSAQLICFRGALAFRRSACGSRRGFDLPAQLQAMLPELRAQRALPARLQAQCRDSTSRRGPSAAGRDARSRPGAVCETARRRRALLRKQDRIRNASLGEQGENKRNIIGDGCQAIVALLLTEFLPRATLT